MVSSAGVERDLAVPRHSSGSKEQPHRRALRVISLNRPGDAFVTLETLEAHEELRSLRARAIFYKFSDGRETLQARELHEWVRELCAGEHHVKRVIGQLLGAETPAVTLTEFVGAISAAR